ncbi:hypothetical protein Syun_012391 [Stephania yunnanensis]|uniref:Aminotransferase-like plant mobile domain-containing protein n=1 Tax=Stephania yunnanensis TaxID=152371 RepID=A0AAP0PJF5_9MAGN
MFPIFLELELTRLRKMLTTRRGLTVRLAWSKSCFCPPKSGCSSTSRTYPRVEFTTRAYLLYWLACILFVDKSRSRVSILLLKVIENLDEVETYAWGAAALAYLCCHFGSARRAEASQIVENITLLEVHILWSL